MRPPPSRPPAALRPGPAKRHSGKVGPLVPALALLMAAGTLYGLWELTGGLAAPAGVPVTLGAGDRSAPDRGGTPQPLLAPGDGVQARRGETVVAPIGPGATTASASAVPDPVEGAALRRRLASVARGFRTATPDLRGLNDLVRSLALHATVLAPSVERGAGATRGTVRLAGTDLEGQFEVRGDAHRILFVETSFDTVHPPFLRLELELAFETPRRELSNARARLAFVPNPERSALDHIAAGDELRVGWEVRFEPDGASARGIGAWVARDLESWRVEASEKTRSDKRVRDLSSFQAWRATLAGVD